MTQPYLADHSGTNLAQAYRSLAEACLRAAEAVEALALDSSDEQIRIAVCRRAALDIRQARAAKAERAFEEYERTREVFQLEELYRR